MKPTIILSLAASTLLWISCGESQSSTSTNLDEQLKEVRNKIFELKQQEDKLLQQIGSKSGKKNNSKLVEVTEISTSEFTSSIGVEATVDANNSTIATAQVPGTVIQIKARVGQKVNKGDILATLDNNSLLKSKLELQQQFDFAKTIYEKQMRLWKKGIGTEIQYLTAKNQSESLEKSLNTLNANIDMYSIKSPINGTIEAVDLKVGQVAAPGMPYFKVINMNKLKAVADVSETYSGSINQGDFVEVNFPDLNKTISGEISFASNYIDALNRTFKVEVNLPLIKAAKPNMIAKLKIVDYQSENAIVIPSNCIQKTERETFVMGINNTEGYTTAKKIIVKTGVSNKNTTEIIEGLNEGDQIIINGFQELSEGQNVTVQ
jgi:membrane fusion protein, multidrug efflux system